MPVPHSVRLIRLIANIVPKIELILALILIWDKPELSPVRTISRSSYGLQQYETTPTP